MTCEQARILIAEELGGPLAAMAGVELNAHLSACPGCRAEADLIRKTWAAMAALPEPDPRPYMPTRFHAALDAYQQGLRERPRRAGFWSWWPARPLWQFAVALGCLVVGLFTGASVFGNRTASGEVAELRKEMSGMRQLVTLSLLQQQSAAERLRGVTYSYRAEPNDMEVLGALLQTVNQDSNVDVRLAAIDALRAFANNPVARRGLVQALLKQDSPMTQIAIVDALTELGERSAVPGMRQLLSDPGLNESVRKRLTRAIETLQ